MIASLLFCRNGRNFVQSLVRIGHPDELCLSAVNTATQSPAAVGIGAVVHKAMPAEETLATEGFHIYRHPVAGLHGGHGGADFLHHTHHLMAYSDTGHRPGHRAMLDVQIAGADAARSHPVQLNPEDPDHRLVFSEERICCAQSRSRLLRASNLRMIQAT